MDFRKFLTTLPLDKIVHFFVGAFIYAVASPWGVGPALLATFLIANAKEVVDSFVHGTFDFNDMWVTFAGGLVLAAWLGYIVPNII